MPRRSHRRCEPRAATRTLQAWQRTPPLQGPRYIVSGDLVRVVATVATDEVVTHFDQAIKPGKRLHVARAIQPEPV